MLEQPSLGLHSSGHLRRSSATPLVTNRSTGGVNSGRMSLATLGLKTLDPHQRPAVSLHFLDYTNPLTYVGHSETSTELIHSYRRCPRKWTPPFVV